MENNEAQHLICESFYYKNKKCGRDAKYYLKIDHPSGRPFTSGYFCEECSKRPTDWYFKITKVLIKVMAFHDDL